ncbi:MAG: glycosyltransferase family 2 protein, partial [Flavobacterium sp.]|nr:glycosyltransferase family 2 protein [Flavobacterium sp.]
FLNKTIAEFTSDNIGMVQTGWDHLNLDYSILTKTQAFGLDAHFTIEQSGRNNAGLLINFNGTAGIWRKTCIEDAGGWEHDTLTEDLDLSYRAQLKGWDFKFIEDIRTPAELPVEMSAIKSQQFRWTKGSVETAKKIIPSFVKSDLPFKQKLFGLLHLLNPFIFVFMFVTGVLSIPLLYIKNQNNQFDTYFNFASVFILGFLIMIVFHWITSRSILHRKLSFWEFIKLFPTFCSISLGLSYHNTKAVLEGIIGKKTPFIRTPKFNVRKLKDQFLNNKYLTNRLSPSTFTEILLSVYFFSGIYLAFYFNDYGLLPFHLMLFVGFSMISCYSIAHARAK